MVAVSTQIAIDEQGVAWLAGTKIKVVEVVLDKLACGWSPEEIHFQHSYLSLAQIHAALAYYYENQSKLDSEIEHRRRQAESVATSPGDLELRQKLLALKKTR